MHFFDCGCELGDVGPEGTFGDYIWLGLCGCHNGAFGWGGGCWCGGGGFGEVEVVEGCCVWVVCVADY